jgi:PAS domain S-box-containing protein
MVNENHNPSNSRPGSGHEPQIQETDTLQRYRQKLARIALDEMYQFVAILDTQGTLLDVNQAALVGAGLKPSDVEGKPFWECYWWAVSKEIQETLKAAIIRAAKGEFIRYDVEIYGRAAGKETIIIDFSIIPVRDNTGDVVYLVPEGRDITEKKAIEELHVHLIPSAPYEAAQSRTPTKINILVVEDNTDMNTFISQTLSPDYHVISAFNGQEGLQKALELKPTLIIIDIMMPRVSSVQMIAQIHQHPELINVPILILSARVDEELTAKPLLEGTQDFMTKPFSKHDLLIRVRNLIAQTKVQERLRMLAAIVESSDDAILSKDLDGIITSWNPAAERIYGYTAEEIVGQPVTWLFPPDHHDEFQQIMTRIRQGERVDHYETRRRHKDGTFLTMSITVSPIKDEMNVITGASTIARDITKQKQLEAKSQRLFASNLIGIIVADGTGTVLEVNDGFLDLVGYTRAEWQTAMLQHTALIASAVPFLKPSLLKAVQATGSSDPQEMVVERKNGELIPVLVAMARIEETETYIGFVLDISERKALEQRKDEFISMASHELKTPVTSLKGFLHLLQRRLAPQDDVKARHYLARMDAQIDKLTTLVNDLLDISKMQTGHLVYREEYFEMDGLVQEIIENVQETTQTHHLWLEGQPQAQVYGDRDRLGQVLINLLTNAIKYSPQADTVRVRLAIEENRILVSVQDFGPGIAKEHLSKIFERYYQVIDPKKKTSAGLGIGLYISSEIVKRQHGRIWVESQTGAGSIFHMSLPLVQAEERSADVEQE